MKSEYRKQYAVMLLCILFGGFSLILFLFMVYSVAWGLETFGMPQHMNNLSENMSFPAERMISENPMMRLTSPIALIFLFNGIVLIIGGITIWRLTREKEIRSAKEKITSLLLLPEERTVIEELKKSKGAITQSQLVRNTGLSKVKIHRIVTRLAAKGVVKKHPYGLTNKIVLEKDV